MELYFITWNKNKFEEVNKILPTIKHLDINLEEIQELDPKKIIQAKVIEAFKYKKWEFIIEDTSLYFDCLNWLPWPFIKWFIDKLWDVWIYNIVNKLWNTQAEAKTMIWYAKSINEIYYFEWGIRGNIVKPNIKSNFWRDSIFQPNWYDKTFAELTKKEKNTISMRSIVINKLKIFLWK